ncbi:MAG: tyrosine-type recombinase/integrase [Saprospiraceae bacterium]|nr:tyrosine-type recombinase/integrase [Saprospiraceae bacterium]
MDANLAVIQTDNLQPIKDLVLNGLDSPESKRAYGRALDSFFSWYSAQNKPGLSKALVNEYKTALQERGLSAATINLQLSAIRKLAIEAKDNGLIDPVLAAGIQETKGVKSHGVKIGNWLNKQQAQDLIHAPDLTTIIGIRDHAIIAVMIGTGLRRSELVSLTFEHIQQRENRWIIADITGKGNRVRTVPMPTWAKSAIDQWATAAGISSGLVFRSIHRGGKVNGSLTNQAIRNIILNYGGPAPHDLRRTFSKLAHKGGAAIEQISLTLGHASIKTTEIYLGIEQDLTSAPCDFITLTI